MNINARSVMNKSADLESIILAHKPHILIITETYGFIPMLAILKYYPPVITSSEKIAILVVVELPLTFRNTLRVTRLTDITGVECGLAKFFLND